MLRSLQPLEHPNDGKGQGIAEGNRLCGQGFVASLLVETGPGERRDDFDAMESALENRTLTRLENRGANPLA